MEKGNSWRTGRKGKKKVDVIFSSNDPEGKKGKNTSTVAEGEKVILTDQLIRPRWKHREKYQTNTNGDY